jgi:hypothetical protein
MARRLKLGITAVLALLVVGAIVLPPLLLPRLAAERSAVPFQYMWVSFEDEEGVATIRSEAFLMAFPGHVFGSPSRGGNYVVDGRYGFRLFGGPDSLSDQVGGGVTSTYSQRQRLLVFRYEGHEVAYSHALQKLTVDGHEYSTAGGPVHLRVKEGGEVERVDQ